MDAGNKFLNNLFNSLSSVYSSNGGMVNSNLFVLFNAYASELQDINNITLDTSNNTYLNLADTNALAQNFGPYVDFQYPPRLNTVTNGGEIYRSILRSLYNAFLHGATEEGMVVGLSTVLSLITIDSNTNTIMYDTNNVSFTTFDRSIQLAYPALSSSGTIAQPSDISIVPSGLYVTAYDPTTQIIQFQGVIPISGQSYQIGYYRDHTNQINTNWVNLTNPSGTSPLPTDLKTIENTYRNPKFSYWWNTYNRDGNGVKIIDGTLDPSEVGLVWRLPEKYITFVDPYTHKITKSSIELYNLSGTVYDINSSNKDINPDYEQTTQILSYVNEVSRQPNDFYVRYSQNNSIFTALVPISGNLTQVEKVSDISVDFASTNFGNLDFFEKGNNFDINDLFGLGTKNVWTEVQNKKGIYSLSSQNYFNRPFSLHEDILFEEFFENGWRSLSRMGVLAGSTMLAEAVGTPLESSEDCLMLYGSNASVYPMMSSGITSSGNRFQIDIFDPGSVSGLSSVNINFTNPLDSSVTGNNQVRFAICGGVSPNETLVGPSGYTVVDTIPFNFVDTYFTNIDNLNYAIKYPSLSTLDNGNTNPNSSYHLKTSGVGNIYPNLPNIQNVDEFILEISTDKNFDIQWTNALTGLPSFGGYYNNTTNSIKWIAGSNVFVHVVGTGYSYPIGTPPYWSINGNGSGIVIQNITTLPSIFKFVFQKGKVPQLNGVSVSWMPNPFDTPNLGLLSSNGLSFTFNSPKSILVSVSNGSPSKIYHYSMGNTNAINAFYAGQTNSSYYYQFAPNGTDINNAAKNTLPIPNIGGWHRVVFDFGSGLNHLMCSVDEYKFIDHTFSFSGNFGFTNDLNDSKSITLNHTTLLPGNEYSYFDNAIFSYYTPELTRPQYNVQENVSQDWQGSYLDQSTVLSNRTFKGTRQANFIFELNIKGLDNKFLYIIEDLVKKLKPAHTLVDINIETDHTLNTTSILSKYIGNPENWETGNLLNSVYVTTGINTSDPTDLQGIIEISGTQV